MMTPRNINIVDISREDSEDELPPLKTIGNWEVEPPAIARIEKEIDKLRAVYIGRRVDMPLIHDLAEKIIVILSKICNVTFYEGSSGYGESSLHATVEVDADKRNGYLEYKRYPEIEIEFTSYDRRLHISLKITQSRTEYEEETSRRDKVMDVLNNPEYKALLDAGDKVAAIELYRQITKCSVKEANDAVEITDKLDKKPVITVAKLLAGRNKPLGVLLSSLDCTDDYIVSYNTEMNALSIVRFIPNIQFDDLVWLSNQTQRACDSTKDNCIDNLRWSRHPMSERYQQAVKKGCCGSLDEAITNPKTGNVFWIGLNYGH